MALWGSCGHLGPTAKGPGRAQTKGSGGNPQKLSCVRFKKKNGGEPFNLKRQRDSILEIHSFTVAKWRRMLGSIRQTLIFTFMPLLPSFGTLGKWFQSSILMCKMRTTLHTSKGCFKETQRKVPSVHRGSKNVGYCFPFIEQTFIEYAGHLLGMTEMKKSRFLPWKTPKSISQPPLPATHSFRYPIWAPGDPQRWCAARPRTPLQVSWSQRPHPGLLIQGQASSLNEERKSCSASGTAELVQE